MKKFLAILLMLLFSTQIFAFSSSDIEIKKRSSIQSLVGILAQNEFNKAVKLYYQENIFEAYESFQKACNKGYGFSCTYLGALYSNNNHATKELITSLFKKGCEAGDGSGCNHLAVIYQSGQNVDYNLVVKLYRLACDLGEPLGCYNLGVLYKESTKSDATFIAKATELFSLGCDKNSVASCLNLAFLFEEQGYIQEAINFYHKSCSLGSSQGCGIAGNIFQLAGDERASNYFTASCQLGDEAGCKALESLKTANTDSGADSKKQPKKQKTTHPPKKR